MLINNLDEIVLRKLMDIMHDCLYAKTYADAVNVINCLSEIIPFNAAIICEIQNDNNSIHLSEKLNHSFPVDWVSEYFSKKYYMCDPVAQASLYSTSSYTWESAFESEVELAQSKDFLSMAKDHGLHDGVAFTASSPRSLHKRTLLSLETNGIAVSGLYLAIVNYIYPHIHEMLISLDDFDKITQEIPRFTLREKETLKWAYEGKTAWEIGVILSISERTVKFHLKNIYQKLNVRNRSQAVAKAIRYGLV